MLLVIQGKVDDWRVQRNCAYLSYAVHIEESKRTSMLDAVPLAYDDEIKADDKILEAESLEAWYKNIADSGYFDKPIGNAR